jgi:hypothetical protein
LGFTWFRGDAPGATVFMGDMGGAGAGAVPSGAGPPGPVSFAHGFAFALFFAEPGPEAGVPFPSAGAASGRGEGGGSGVNSGGRTAEGASGISDWLAGGGAVWLPEVCAGPGVGAAELWARSAATPAARPIARTRATVKRVGRKRFVHGFIAEFLPTPSSRTKIVPKSPNQ